MTDREHTATCNLLGTGRTVAPQAGAAHSILPPMNRQDALVRLLSSHLRRYTREPETRAASARNMLLHAFMLYALLSSEEDALDAVTAAYTFVEAA